MLKPFQELRPLVRKMVDDNVQGLLPTQDKKIDDNKILKRLYDMNSITKTYNSIQLPCLTHEKCLTP